MPIPAPEAVDRTRSRLLKALTKRSRRRRLLWVSITAGNVLLIGVVVWAVIGSSSGNSNTTPLASAVNKTSTSTIDPLDQVASASIAQTVARMSNLPESTAVTNQADSQIAELSMTPVTSSVVSKPQVVATTSFASNKDIKSYTTVAGDTISSIAAKFGITSDSVRWSNGLSGDSIKAGVQLWIPPISGIVYTVKAGDTPVTLAAKFRADQNKIIAYNDAEINGIKVGERILIPDGSIVPVLTRASYGWSGAATYGFNGYDYGYCTWWVAKLRAAAGNPVPTNLGNASTWVYRASAMGLPTGTTPRVGAAVVLSTRGAGHVAYVTAVNSDGSITVSEMNHSGWNVVDTRTVSGVYQYLY